MDTTTGFSKKEKLVFGNISLSENQKKVYIKDSLVDLTPNEFSLLQFMIENQTRAVSREELLQSIWGYNLEVETRVADDTVRRLRKKIQTSNVQIETVWGYGFRLKMINKDAKYG